MRLLLTKCEDRLFKDLVQSTKHLHVIIRVSGGWVRDKLMQRSSADIDLVLEKSSACPFLDDEQLVTEFGRSFAEVGRVGLIKCKPQFGKHKHTATFRLHGISLDVSVLERNDVTFDAQGRDLSINALFFNIHTNVVEDFVYGVEDLQRGMLRTPGTDELQTLLRDPLRIVRLCRFEAAMKFQCDSKLTVIIQSNLEQLHNALLENLSSERLTSELTKIFLHPSVADGVQCLERCQIMKKLLPDVRELCSSALRLLSDELFAEKSDDLVLSLRLAAYMKDVSIEHAASRKDHPIIVQLCRSRLKMPVRIGRMTISFLEAASWWKSNWDESYQPSKFAQRMKLDGLEITKAALELVRVERAVCGDSILIAEWDQFVDMLRSSMAWVNNVWDMQPLFDARELALMKGVSTSGPHLVLLQQQLLQWQCRHVWLCMHKPAEARLQFAAMNDDENGTKHSMAQVGQPFGHRFSPVDDFERESNWRDHDLQMQSTESNVFIGPYTSLCDPFFLSKHGITHAINASRCTSEVARRYGIKVLDVDLKDSTNAKLEPHLAQCRSFIQRAIDTGGKVLIVCFAGVSRSASIHIDYWMYRDGLTFQQARDRLRKVRSCVHPNRSFRNELEEIHNRKLTEAKVDDASTFSRQTMNQDSTWSDFIS
jgi:tRNA nucleotidyltransferase/poly(A) polymerase